MFSHDFNLGFERWIISKEFRIRILVSVKALFFSHV